MKTTSSVLTRLLALLLCLLGVGPNPAHAAGEPIRFEVPIIPALARYADLLAYPGYLAIALENIGLSPSVSSKLLVNDRGRGVEIHGAVLRYTGRKEAVFSYEAGVSMNLGLANSTLAFPVTVDASAAGAGKITVAMTPPLAKLFPRELIERIRIKTQMIASVSAQQKALDYFDGLAKRSSKAAGVAAYFEPILLEAYNKGSGPGSTASQDVGDALPLSDQWILLLTLTIWVVIVPAALLVQRVRRRRTKPV